MKKVVFGGILILSGVMLLGIVYIPSSIYCKSLSSWTNPKGMYAIQELGMTFPYRLSIILLIVGIVIGFLGCFEDSIRKLKSSYNKG